VVWVEPDPPNADGPSAPLVRSPIDLAVAAGGEARRVLVVSRAGAWRWLRALGELPGTQVVETPAGRGAACGLLAATLRIAAWDPRGYMAAVRLHPEDDGAGLGRRVALQRARGPTRLHVEDRFAAGPVTAFVDQFGAERPELLLAVRRRPSATWNVGGLEALLTGFDDWSDVFSRPSGPRDLTPA
jgi:hypothetical protein